MVMEIPQTELIEIALDGKILIITINNAPNNYLPSGFFTELAACRELMLSSEVGAVVFTGKGVVFSKGADINELRTASHKLDSKTLTFGNQIFTFIANLTKPVIAAINGACFGGGLELALACHIRLCSEKARLGLPEVSIGLVPGLGGLERLIRVVGEAKALEMVLLGDMIPAAQALELRLVNRVLPKQDFLPKVLLLVKTILSAPQGALKEVIKLALLSRPESEERAIGAAVDSFIRLVAMRGGPSVRQG